VTWQAILFDLDGTLLDIRMSDFVPRYFQALTRWAAAHGVPAEEFMARLHAATEAMLRNQGPETNAQVFARHFYPLAGRGEEHWRPVFDAFYREVFPQLRGQAGPRLQARRVVEAALARGYPVVLATNPAFPEAAVRQRMAWAGVDDLPFALVTTYENCRATKPNPRYYRGICDALGVEPSRCLMIGDEPMDLAAAQAGLTTYWVDEGDNPPPADLPWTPTWHGPLEGVLAVL